MKKSSASDRVDVAIVGGGAAGIAAARRLTELRRSVLLIEASPQLGGRARTKILQGMPLDLGCGWLHSARRNALAKLAEARGQELDRSEAAWRRRVPNLASPSEDQREAWAAFEKLGERLHDDAPHSDAVGDALASDDRWRPFIDGVSSFINGTEIDQLSVADYLAYEDAATDDNWRVPSGYGAFIVGLGAGITTALGTTRGAPHTRHRHRAADQSWDDPRTQRHRGGVNGGACTGEDTVLTFGH